MKIWLNGKRRDLKLTPAAKSAGGVVLALIYLGTFPATALVNHDRLNWWFWVSGVVGLWPLLTFTTSLTRQIRGGDRIRITSAPVLDSSSDEI